MTAQTVAPMSFDQEMAALQAKYGVAPVAPVAPVTVKLPTDVLATPSATIPVTVKTTPAAPKTNTITVPGFAITLTGGTFDQTVKPTISRATTNPWYAVIEWLATQPAGYLTITRTDTKVKSPASAIWSMILRAQKLGIKRASKMTVGASATDKHVWYLIAR